MRSERKSERAFLVKGSFQYVTFNRSNKCTKSQDLKRALYREINLHLYWISFPNYLVVVVLTLFAVWMSIKAFPLTSGGWLTQFTAELGSLSADESLRVMQALCHARSELLGKDTHRDFNFFFPLFTLTTLYSLQDRLRKGVPDVICEAMAGVKTILFLVSESPFIA